MWALIPRFQHAQRPKRNTRHFCIRHFHAHVIYRKCLHFDSDFIDFCSFGSISQLIIIYLCNDLTPNKWQAIICIIDEQVIWRINVCIKGGFTKTHFLCSCRFSPIIKSWWRHQMETFSALLGLCAGNSPVTGEFPSQKPMTQSFGVFYLCLNKRSNKQSRRWWFETPSRSLWSHCKCREKTDPPTINILTGCRPLSRNICLMAGTRHEFRNMIYMI